MFVSPLLHLFKITVDYTVLTSYKSKSHLMREPSQQEHAFNETLMADAAS